MRRGSGDPAVSRVADPFRLALGTLTVLPTRPPTVVDRRVGGWAMVLAPAVGALIAVPAGLFMWLLGWGPRGIQPLLAEVLGQRAHELVPGPLLTAALTIALLALLTRAMHLDGLADTVDGLGSDRPAAEALDIMRRGDVGPFGVVALVLVLIVQVLALGDLVGGGHGAVALLAALVVSRVALPLACWRGIPAARAGGLGQAVAGSVGPVRLLAAALLTVLLVVPPAVVGVGAQALSSSVAVRAGVATALALLAGALVVRHAVRRLGGITGDVLGAAVEITFTVALVVLSLLD